MVGANLVLVPCDHALADGDISTCGVCQGVGHVAVIPGEDGKPIRCPHGLSRGSAADCTGCDGAGWAGMVSYRN